MAFLRVTVSLIALTGLGAASVEAQSTRAHVIAAPQGRPRVASIAPPPPPPRRVYSNGETIFQSNPMIVTPDGRVLIDLGNGYEEVARACPYAYGYDCESYGYPTAPQSPDPDLDGPNNGQPAYVPPRYAPPAYAAPVYHTPTYPSGGASGYYPTPSRSGYSSPTPPPTNNYDGCPRGYFPTGSSPPCIDPSRSSAGTVARPPSSGVQSGSRPAVKASSPARVIRR